MACVKTNLLDSLEEQLPILLDTFGYIPLYLALPYLRKRPNSTLTLFTSTNKIHLSVDDTRSRLLVMAIGLETVNCVGMAPDLFQERTGIWIHNGRRASNNILHTKCYFGNLDKPNPLVAQRHYSFNRQAHLVESINQIVELHNELNKEIPSYYIYPYLFFNKDAIIKCSSSTKVMKYSSKYCYLKIDSRSKCVRESFHDSPVGGLYMKKNNNELIELLYGGIVDRLVVFTLYD